MTALFIITSNYKTPQSLNRRHSCLLLLRSRHNGGQLTQLIQGGSKVRRLVNQLSWERPAQNYVILTGLSEKPDLRKGILK